MLRSSKNAERRPKALSLDLFGTIVFFDPSRLPRRTVDGESRVMTVPDVEALLARVAPSVSVAAFLEAIVEEGRAIAEAKQQSLREVPTRERFRRALVRLGATGELAAVASTMAERHMASLADAVTCPADRSELLRELATRHPIALVSNFDHGATARRLLDRFGLADALSSIRISEEVGFIKPSRDIFLAACADLAVDAADALHVGDSLGADIEGARGAGLRALWIGRSDGDSAADTIADLSDLPRWLDARYG